MSVWIKELLKNLDEHVDPDTRMKIMQACGEKCPFTHLPDDRLLGIKNSAGSEHDFLMALCEQWRLKKENGRYFVVFYQCYCPLVNDDISGASRTLCLCTLGNLKRKFAMGLDREVNVTMESTILAGDRECRFLIKI